MYEVSWSNGQKQWELLQSLCCLSTKTKGGKKSERLFDCSSVVMFSKGKPENKNVYCQREQKIVTENSFHDRLLAGQQVGSVM